jgi:hypothetical protein
MDGWVDGWADGWHLFDLFPFLCSLEARMEEFPDLGKGFSQAFTLRFFFFFSFIEAGGCCIGCWFSLLSRAGIARLLGNLGRWPGKGVDIAWHC